MSKRQRALHAISIFCYLLIAVPFSLLIVNYQNNQTGVHLPVDYVYAILCVLLFVSGRVLYYAVKHESPHHAEIKIMRKILKNHYKIMNSNINFCIRENKSLEDLMQSLESCNDINMGRLRNSYLRMKENAEKNSFRTE